MAPHPRDLGPTDLVLSHFTLAPDHPVEDRVACAAANQIPGIGLYVGHYRQLEESGFAPSGLRDLLDDAGVCLAEIEVITGLGADGPGGERARAMEEVAWRMADEFGCRSVQVIGPADAPADEAAIAFGALCDRAADHGLLVNLEFLPFTDIISVADARAIVEPAARPNGGICVDIWHHERGARDLAAIAALPGELITGVQMSDGTRAPADPDYYADCLANRVPPGEGEFDIPAFIEAIRSTGSRAPWALEVCSAHGWSDPAEHVARSAAGLRALLSAQ